MCEYVYGKEMNGVWNKLSIQFFDDSHQLADSLCLTREWRNHMGDAGYDIWRHVSRIVWEISCTNLAHDIKWQIIEK